MSIPFPADYAWRIVDLLVKTGEKLTGSALGYDELPGGFSCRTCRYAEPISPTTGQCQLMIEPISLDHGCCMTWEADLSRVKVISGAHV